MAWADLFKNWGEPSLEDLAVNGGYRTLGGNIQNRMDMPINAGNGMEAPVTFRDLLFGSTNQDGITTPGFAMPAIQGFNALSNAYLGMQNYGLAKKTFKENQRQFDMNFDAQRGIINSQMADRQNRRKLERPEQYMSADDYVAKYGVK